MRTPQRHKSLFMRLSGHFPQRHNLLCGVIKIARRAFTDVGCSVVASFLPPGGRKTGKTGPSRPALAAQESEILIAPCLPSISELQPQLEKLQACPGSVILVAIDQPEACCNFARCTWAWLSKEERKALKSALERCRLKRSRRNRGKPSGITAFGPNCGEP